MGPITNYELGKRLHHEYEVEASRYRGQDLARNKKLSVPMKYKLALALRGGTLLALLSVLILAI